MVKIFGGKFMANIANNIKKIVFLFILSMTLSMTAFANNTTVEKLYEFGKHDKKVIEEINYYLSKGAVVKILHTVALNELRSAYSTVVIQIPKAVLENEPYQPKK